VYPAAASGQAINAPHAPRLRSASHDHLGDCWVEIDAACGDGSDCRNKFLGRRAFENVARNARFEQLAQVRPVFMHREDEYMTSWHLYPERLSHPNAVHPWHRQVQHDHIGFQLAGQSESRLAVHGFADYFYCRFVLHQRFQSREHEAMVISDQYPDARRRLCVDHHAGIRQKSAVP
jgi:hypothetical protein